MKKELIIILIFCILLTSCGKSSSMQYPYYEQYLKEQAAIEKEMEEKSWKIWFYGEDSSFDRSTYYNNYFAESVSDMITSVIYKENDIELEQYQKKLQASIMAGDGTDLIVSSQANLLTDIKKSIKAGAFADWSIYMESLSDRYRTSALDALMESDGQLYVFPISYDVQVIVTTKTMLDETELDLNDFSDFYATTHTIHDLWKNSNDQTVHCTLPGNFCLLIPDLMNYDTQTTNIMDPANQKLLLKWKEIIETGCITETETNRLLRILNGSSKLEFMGLYETLESVKYLPPEKREELVIIPQRDTNGDMIGNVYIYALLPINSKNPQAAMSYIDQIFIEEDFMVPGFPIGEMNSSNFQIYMTEDPMDSEYGYIKNQLEILNTQTKLWLVNKIVEQYNAAIINELLSPQPDWEELERSINIYLSE